MNNQHVIPYPAALFMIFFCMSAAEKQRYLFKKDYSINSRITS